MLELGGIPVRFRRKRASPLPAVSEMQAVWHYTRLPQKNSSTDTQSCPLGSCTMKSGSRGCNSLAMLPGFVARHPNAPESHSQGFLACMYELQEMLKVTTGMTAVALIPAAGAQGEFASVAMTRADHGARGDSTRTEILVPEAVEALDRFVDTLVKIKAEALDEPDLIEGAPDSPPVRRLDENRVTRELDRRFQAAEA